MTLLTVPSRACAAVAALALALTAALVHADDAVFTDDGAWIDVSMTPMALPDPALRYELLPIFNPDAGGNAATAYLKATLALPGAEIINEMRVKRGADLMSLRSMQIHDDALGGRTLFGFLEAGAECTHCDWETGVTPDTFASMPEVTPLRSAAELTCLRARVQMAHGDLDGALATLRVGFALAEDVGSGPTALQRMVGVAIAAMFVDTAIEFTEQPGAPNLYWALATLPEPFVDVRGAVRHERVFMDEIVPHIHAIRSGALADEMWDQVAAETVETIGDLVSLGGDRRLTALAWGMASYPGARQRMIERGATAADVDALPTMQVLLTDAVHEYDRARDAMYRWVNLPYHEAIGPLLVESERIAAEMRPGGRGWPYLHLLPALERVLATQVQLERRLAALRIIEALRAHAAATGDWPTSLDAVTIVPIPIDPVSGEPFRYRRVSATHAELAAPHPAYVPARQRLRFRLQLGF